MVKQYNLRFQNGTSNYGIDLLGSHFVIPHKKHFGGYLINLHLEVTDCDFKLATLLLCKYPKEHQS